MIHVFFESLDAWIAASCAKPVYAMPMQFTRPTSSNMAWKESKIQLSQVCDETGAIHHCLFLVGRYLEPVEDHEKQKHAERLDQYWRKLRAWLDRGRYTVFEGMLSYPKDTTTVDTYLPTYILEPPNAEPETDLIADQH